MNPRDVIVRRIVSEIRGRQRVALGPGMPVLAEGAVAPDTEVFRLEDPKRPPLLELAIVEAAEVSQSGDLCLKPGSCNLDVNARRWVVATLQTDAQGNPKIVRKCRQPVFRKRCVSTIITEKGVIEVTDQGLVLREIRPGVATDDVKKETAASLHVADDIKLMEI